MALESIGATGGRSYVDVVKNVNKAPQTQVKAAEETAKKAPQTTPMVAAPVSTEAKGAQAENKQPEEEQQISTKMKDAIDKVNEKIVPSKTRCEFSYHEETNRISIKVIDQATEETIREIPAEETLNMLSKIWELAGLLVDERR